MEHATPHLHHYFLTVKALQYLQEKIVHLSISIECKTPKISPKIDEMRKNIARLSYDYLDQLLLSFTYISFQLPLVYLHNYQKLLI